MLLLVQARDGRGEKERERFAHPNHPNGCNSVERLSMTIVSTMNALLCQKYMRENCIHSIKYKYLTVTMYLRYLLISNIKSKKWLEGPNQKLSSSIPLAGSLWVCSLTLSIHINAMYYTHTHTHTILLQNVFSLHTFIVQDFDCKSQFFCRFHQIWFFYFSVLWVYGFDFFSLSLSLSHPFYKFMSEHLILARFFLVFFCNIHFYYKLSSIHISACLDRRQQQDKQHRNHSHVYQRLKKNWWNPRSVSRPFESECIRSVVIWFLLFRNEIVNMLLNRFYLVRFQYYCHSYCFSSALHLTSLHSFAIYIYICVLRFCFFLISPL